MTVARPAALDGTASRLTRDRGFFAYHGVWAPGVRLFRRLGFGAKATLVSLCFLVPLALVMGSEGSGMRRLTRETCDVLFSIPMAGEVSSLNVSVATGVTLFEAMRQRRPT